MNAGWLLHAFPGLILESGPILSLLAHYESRTLHEPSRLTLSMSPAKVALSYPLVTVPP